jgi:hypothetical protein
MNAESAIPDAQQCKRNAIEAMSRLEDLTDQRVSQGALLLQAAQVWATLATVPEPVYATLDSVVELPSADELVNRVLVALDDRQRGQVRKSP